ncbi:restriction endonuclease [Microbulbifer sp. ZKSA004]|uniref:restriction endonuclease n=1 Tax=Microbulbifer sp. ZKSA004 TaxID=3243389 RepID=UPI00403A393F
MGNILNKTWEWVLEYSWNIFNVFGVFATFYFGFFYVPEHVKESMYQKSALAQEELIQEVGGRFFANENVTIQEVRLAIEQKEVYYKLSFPYSVKQTLLLIRNDFSKNSYISLERRSEIKLKIQGLISEIKEPVEEGSWWSKFSLTQFLKIELPFILIAVIGLLSVVRKKWIDAETEVDLAENEEEVLSVSGFESLSGYEYQALVSRVLRGLKLLDGSEGSYIPGVETYASEFSFVHKGKNIFVETKAYQKKVGVRTVRSFLYMVRQSGGSGLLVATTPLTIRARQMLDDYNRSNDSSTAYFIEGKTEERIESEIRSKFSVDTKTGQSSVA